MTEPLWSPPARTRAPGHTLRPEAAPTRLETLGSDRDPGLGWQTPEKATSSSAEDQTSVNTHVPDEINPEVQPTTPMPNWEADVEDTEGQTVAKTETEHLTGMDTTNPVTDPGTHGSSKEGTMALPGIRSPRPTENWMWYHFNEPEDWNGWNEEDDIPFHYDEFTLRKRGLVVAAVLFILGIIILTSGKCRQLSQICLNRHRAYGGTQKEP
ncbi:hypothetical protein A6R68_12654 [Neotoma lepida]|uniref:FXYD domain-containing ion transport regulator n=1 Tax=Neotoma lepida TaxID=56216 RepID=A0A1A6H2G6_NEOLE|nr:hypothetical protein A6R68_12654 [Neotoma lepida]